MSKSARFRCSPKKLVIYTMPNMPKRQRQKKSCSQSEETLSWVEIELIRWKARLYTALVILVFLILFHL